MNRRSGLFFAGMLAFCSLAGAEALAEQETRPVMNLTLQQAIRMALDHSPELAQAQAEAVRAGELLRETRSLNLPQVVTGTGLAYNNGFPLSIEGSAPSIVQFAVNQSILSKKNRNLILEAEQGSKAAEIATDAARNAFVAKTASIYYELHQARKIEALWAAQLEVAQKSDRVTQSLLEAGRVRPVDVTLAEAVTSSARQRLLVSQEQTRLAEMELRELTGIAGTSSLQTVEPQLDTQALGLPVEALYQRALEIHPELRQAEAVLKAKEFHVHAERGEYYPRLDIVSQYALFSRANNYQDYFNRFTRNNFLVGLSVQLPLFNGYRTSARVAQSQQEVAEARLRLQRMKSELKLQIERGASSLRVARGAVELARLEVTAAQENLKINQTLLEGGRIGTRELESVRLLAQEKEIAALEAAKILWQRQVEVLRLSGTLTRLTIDD